MQYTSSATRNCYESIQICSITWRTYIKSLACQAQSICNISSDITMEAILLSILMGSFLVAPILIIHSLMTERSFLHNFYALKNPGWDIASVNIFMCLGKVGVCTFCLLCTLSRFVQDKNKHLSCLSIIKLSWWILF